VPIALAGIQGFHNRISLIQMARAGIKKYRSLYKIKIKKIKWS